MNYNKMFKIIRNKNNYFNNKKNNKYLIKI